MNTMKIRRFGYQSDVYVIFNNLHLFLSRVAFDYQSFKALLLRKYDKAVLDIKNNSLILLSVR